MEEVQQGFMEYTMTNKPGATSPSTSQNQVGFNTHMEDDEELQSQDLASLNSSDKSLPSHDLSGSAQWTTHTSRKQQAAAKEHKATLHSDADTKGKERLKWATKVATGNDVLLTNTTITIDSETDDRGDQRNAPGSTIKLKMGLSRPQYAHDLRQGGLTEAEKRNITSNRGSSLMNLQDSTTSSPSKTPLKVTFSAPSLSDEGHTAPSIAGGTLTSKTIVTTKVLPANSSPPEAKDMAFYTYRAQLTFGLPKSSDGVNVAKFFRRWVLALVNL